MAFRSRRGCDAPVIDRRSFLVALGCLPLLALPGCAPATPEVTLKAGDAMPPLQLPTSRHHSQAIAAGTGPFLLNFWATWCPPCRAEMAGLDRVHRELSAKGLGVFGISVDTDVFLVQEFALKEKLGLPLLFDRGGAVAQRDFRVTAYPTTFLVDRQGIIVEVWVGDRDWDSAPIRARLERLFQ